MSSFIPSSPRELTPEWVTDAMRGAGALPAGRVSEIEIRALGDGGTGFTGDTVRVVLTYEGADGAPGTLIAKFPTADRQNRVMLEQFDAYAREIRFYREFAHRMPCPTPTYLGSDYDVDGAKKTGPRMSKVIDALPDVIQLAITKDVTKFMRGTKRRYALLIEDLGAGTTVYDLSSPPDDDQLAAALDVLASVHAAFWEDPSIVGSDVFRPVITTTPGLYQTVGRKRCLGMARERWADWFSGDEEAAVSGALDGLRDDVAILNQPRTMIHGDPRSDNILYTDTGQVVLLDWALASHANPGFDVGYLLSSCLTAERLGSRAALVDGYRDSLAARGVSIDRDELRRGVDATYRALAVQILLSIAVLQGESYGEDSMEDLWMPRIVAGLTTPW
ncbi:MAG: phosphotransferase [Actinomycetota bacterium]